MSFGRLKFLWPISHLPGLPGNVAGLRASFSCCRGGSRTRSNSSRSDRLRSSRNSARAWQCQVAPACFAHIVHLSPIYCLVLDNAYTTIFHIFCLYVCCYFVLTYDAYSVFTHYDREDSSRYMDARKEPGDQGDDRQGPPGTQFNCFTRTKVQMLTHLLRTHLLRSLK